MPYFHILYQTKNRECGIIYVREKENSGIIDKHFPAYGGEYAGAGGGRCVSPFRDSDGGFHRAGDL